MIGAEELVVISSYQTFSADKKLLTDHGAHQKVGRIYAPIGVKLLKTPRPIGYVFAGSEGWLGA
jgi:hypothetical protein